MTIVDRVSDDSEARIDPEQVVQYVPTGGIRITEILEILVDKGLTYERSVSSIHSVIAAGTVELATNFRISRR